MVIQTFSYICSVEIVIIHIITNDSHRNNKPGNNMFLLPLGDYKSYWIGLSSHNSEKMAKLTTEEFIKKAREVHGDRYDYSKVEYVNSTTKVCIICPKHGEFWQRPSHHTDGRGCLKCASENNAAKMRVWTEEKCREEASRYSDMKSFRTKSEDAYNAALKHKWLKNYTWLTYMIDVTKPKKKRQHS